MGAWFTTRERVSRALDADSHSYRSDQVDRAIDAGARTIEGQLLWDDIAPRVATKSFDWPNEQRVKPGRLWLGNHGLISVTTMTSGGVAITEAQRVLYPLNDGPPYTRVELNQGTSASFSIATTAQGSAVIAGLWGLENAETPAGALAAAVVSTTATTVDVTDGALVGIGSLLRVDSERLQVTGRAWIDSTHNLAGDMDADTADTLVATSGGTFAAGESIILGAEEMDIKAVTGTNLVVERATNGTVLAAHTGAVDIYVSRRLTVVRGAQGTTAATHSTAAPVVAWYTPPLIEALNVALAMDQVEQELGAYSREVRSGDAAAPATGSGLESAWTRALTAHGRQARAGGI